MIGNVAHIGITVSDMEESIRFYRDILGLKFKGSMIMQGKSTDLLFNKSNTIAKVAYFNGSDNINCPPIELIQFNISVKKNKGDLFMTSVSEICFATNDIFAEFDRLKSLGVKFISTPQEFDSTQFGFGKSIAVYLYDNNDNILELIQPL